MLYEFLREAIHEAMALLQPILVKLHIYGRSTTIFTKQALFIIDRTRRKIQYNHDFYDWDTLVIVASEKG